MKNAIELQQEALETLWNTQSTEREIKTANRFHDSIVLAGGPTSDDYFDNMDSLKEKVKTNIKKYLHQNELVKNQMVAKLKSLEG